MIRAFAILLLLAGLGRAADPDAVAFFEARVRPVLVEHCYSCHGADKQKGGLRLDSRDALRRGGDSGPAVVPGKPEDSRMVQAVRHADKSLKMPPDKRLTAEQVADLERWVAAGAIDPRDGPPGASADADWEAVIRERRNWWSLQPVRKPAIPEVADRAWAANPVDRFIRAKIDRKQLTPAAPADRVALARRLSFVLTGLPPAPEDVRAFAAGQSPAALESYIDRLLASPAFGERWARHWMDVVRYADTYGYEWDIPARGSWRYRDYLVRAFNADVPFDQLVREQIAGDLLERPRINRAKGINESRVGPMFFQLGEKRHGDSAEFNGIHQEMLDNKIDAFSKAFQATTVACARCHDHKLDAVAQKDYYALGGVFMSGRWVANTLDTPDRNRATIERLRALKRDLRREVGRWWAKELDAADRWPKAVAAADGNDLPMEHPLRPWQVAARAERGKKDVAAAWRALGTSYAFTSAGRTGRNARDFREVTDFDGWSIDGVGLRDGPVRAGDYTVSLTGPRVIGRILSAGWTTDAESPRLNGAVRTPFLRTLGAKFVSFQVHGGDFAAARTVVDNAFLTERQAYLAGGDPAWKSYSTFPEMRDRAVYVELATKASNPNFPPRVGLGQDLTAAQIDDPRSWCAVAKVVLHDRPGAPADELSRFRSLFAGDVPDSLAEVKTRYRAWFRAAVDAWATDRAIDDHVRVLSWLLQTGLLPNEGGPDAVTDLVSAYRTTEATLLEPQTANGMADLDPPVDYRLNVRGDYDRPGPAVPRGYLGVFARPALVPKTSGRLALAEFVASADNPLTARVYVNRVWHWLFGAGLVTTPDDFGHLGDRPEHPELLDWLAAWFVEHGWSTKQLVRLLITSQTFLQGDRPSEAARQADPRNRLWHHYPLRRLEAEAIRDAILAASGRLDRRLYGPPVDPPRTAEDAQKRLFSGPTDGGGRRSIYTRSTIMDPPRFLAAFNQPPAKIPTGRRDVTSVPAQALAMLNDPFVIGQAEVWGRRLAAEPTSTVENRLRTMFEVALGRPPTDADLARWSGLVGDLAAAHGMSREKALTSAAVWKDVAHALFNVKEFIYVR